MNNICYYPFKFNLFLPCCSVLERNNITHFVVLFHGRIAAISCYTLRLVMKQYRGFLAFSGQMESARNTTRYSLCLMQKRRRRADLVYLTNSKETNYIPSNSRYYDATELNLTLKDFHIYLIKFISKKQLPHFRLILYH